MLIRSVVLNVGLMFCIFVSVDSKVYFCFGRDFYYLVNFCSAALLDVYFVSNLCVLELAMTYLYDPIRFLTYSSDYHKSCSSDFFICDDYDACKFKCVVF